VTRIDVGQQIIVLKTREGEIIASLSTGTSYLRVAPGAQTLAGATPISLNDVGVGDIVMARGRVAEDKKSVSASQIIVMKKADITQKQERTLDEWRQRGIAGRVTAVDPQTHEIKLLTSTATGDRPVTLVIGTSVVFLRYAQDSVKYSDAMPSSFADIKVGDQLRAIGEKSADGSKFTAETVISGSFRLVGGAITAADVEKREITIQDIPTNKPVKIAVNDKSMLRRVPAEYVAALKEKKTPGGQGRGTASDIQEKFDEFPAVSMQSLKPGDMILVISTPGADPARVTAVMLAAGLDPLFPKPSAQPRPGGLVGAVGLPRGVFDSLVNVQ